MKIRFLVLFLLAASTAFGQGKKKRHKNALKAAKEHLRYEEFQQAIPLVQDLLNEDPNSAYYNFWMGKCLYITYKKNQALPYFEKVESVNPDVDKEFHYWYGLTLHYNLYFDRAIAAYRKDLERYEPGAEDYVWVNNRISQCLYAKKLSRKKDAEQVKIENMGEKINSEYSEHSPVISANDSVLLYTARRPECLGAEPEAFFYDEDVYVAYSKNGEWTSGENIGRPVNGTGHDATISLTADGKTLYIYRHKKAGGLYVTDFDEAGKKWKEPRAVQKPLNSKFYEASICLSADSSLSFFTSDRPGGFGGRDIYMVRKEGKDKWSEPVNLGPAINTPFDEDAPYFHPDGKTLYYSSNGPNSMGGFDIFVTEMAGENGDAGWLPPLNMGAPVNTPDDDIYFVLSASGKSGYYSSGMEGGYGEKDIYHIKFPYYPYPRRYHIVELAGLVQDVNTLDTLDALVRLVDTETNEVLDSVYTGVDSAQYYFILEPQRSYSLEVTANGYSSTTEEIATPTIEDDDIFMEKNMFLVKPEEPVVEEPVVTKTVNLPEVQHIYYDFDKDDIRDDAENELDIVADFMSQNEEVDVQILAHTDWYGTYEYNVDLSLRRSKNAYDYLVNKRGISPDRISTDHFSENRPIEDNGNDTGRQYNRRSEFRFVMNNKIILTSKKLRTGVEGVYVDRTTPKGEAGFDNEAGVVFETDRPETGPSMGVSAGSSDDSQASSAGSSEDELTGKAAIKAGNVSGKAEIKNESMTASEDEIISAVEELKLHHIYFDFDKYNLRGSSRDELQKVLQILNQFPDLQVEVYGHTDSKGSVPYNQRLSENRANEAYDYLRDAGISETQLVMTGFSELQPLDTNNDSSGRQNNRRVEFKLIRSGKVLVKSQP